MIKEVSVFGAHGRHAQAVHFTADGKLLVSAGQDACVRLWTIPDFAAAGELKGHANSVNSLSFSSDERWLVTASTDKTVRLWDFPARRQVDSAKGHMIGTLSPDGRWAASVSPKGEVVVRDTRTYGVSAEMAVGGRVTVAVFTAEGELLVGGAGPILRFRAADGAQLGEMAGHKPLVMAMRVSRDGRRLASTGADGMLRIWSTRDWKEACAVKLGCAGAFQIAWGPGSDKAAVSADHRIQIFPAVEGRRIEAVDLPVKGVYGLAISPDGRLLACACADGRIRVLAL